VTVTIGLKEASATSTIGQDGRITKSYKHKYLYRTTAGSRPTFADIAADLGIAPGSPYADDLNATAGNAEIEHLLTRPPHCAAEVTITWATNNPVPAEDSTDPSTVRQLWDLRPIIQQRYVLEDRNGDPILNSARTPFDGGIPVDVRLGQAVLKLKILDADFDKTTVLALSGRVNSVTFLGGDPGTVQLDVSAQEAYEGAYHFWNVEYQFSYDPLGWQPKPLDAGFYQLGALGVPVPITLGDLATPTTSDSTKVPEPEPLDGSGNVVPYADRPGSCAFVPVDYFEEFDFNSLPGL
jgi:hypothetical protein